MCSESIHRRKCVPEVELVAHDVGFSERKLIKALVVLEPETRPAAAEIDIMAHWKILNLARAISVPGNQSVDSINGTIASQLPTLVEEQHQEDFMVRSHGPFDPET